jgi:RNA recognition motif-containing protein
MKSLQNLQQPVQKFQRRERRERLFGDERPFRGGNQGGQRRLMREDRPLKQRQIVRQERQAPQKAATTSQLKPLRGGRKLKVRNFDETKVSNDDLKTLFEKIGKLKECRFDRNEFGQFLGSATVVFENFEEADKAIEEYHGALLDNKVLTVEHDLAAIVKVAKLGGGGGAAAGN